MTLVGGAVTTKPLHASFKFYTSSTRLVEVLGRFQKEHKVAECSKNKGVTQHVPTDMPALCRQIVIAINHNAQAPAAPAMPVVLCRNTKSIAQRASFEARISTRRSEDFAAVVESGPTTKRIVEEIVDLNGLVSQTG